MAFVSSGTALVATMALLCAVAASAGPAHTSAGPPSVPMPYTTTMLRTHHFVAAEFLSIYEQLSVRESPTEPGTVEQAYHIFPGVPFSMRDANNTIVLGIRVVYRVRAGNTSTSYFLTDLDGNERCVQHVTQPNAVAPPPVSVGTSTVRGIADVEGWSVTLPNGQKTTTYYVHETRGGPYANGTGVQVMYPFRIELLYPAGGPEVGYLLDQGSHYPVEVKPWYSIAGCGSAKPVPTPRAVVRAASGGFAVADPDHWTVLARA